MACQQEGGGWNFFSTFGWSTRSPFSRRGLAAFLLCCVFAGFLCFDNLRVLLARVVWLFMWFSFFFSLLFARPWLLIRELGVRLLAFLSTRGPASCLCSVLLCLSVLFSWRCGVLFCLFHPILLVFARLSCLLVVLGVRGGFSYLLRVCLCPKRVCEHRRLPQHLA